MLPGTDRRYKDLKSLCTLLQERCCPTPFVYETITNMGIVVVEDEDESSGGKKVCCCIACINWVRRLSPPSSPLQPACDEQTNNKNKKQKSSSASKKNIPIPIDNLIFFLMCPGSAMVKPDQRSLHRLMCSIANQVAVFGLAEAEGGGGGGGLLQKPHVVQNTYLKYCTPMMAR
jgi:hypothetical protein